MSVRAVIALSLLLGLAPAYARDDTAADRVRIFAQLPNWNGLWESKLAVDSEHLSGYPVNFQNKSGQESLTKYFKLAAKPPYKPEWAQAHRPTARSTATPGKMCGDAPFPAMLELPHVFQILITPEETLFLYEDGDFRHVYTDGRGHPKKEDLWPTETGNSVGHWEGSTLVIDTISVTPGPILPFSFFPSADLSEQAHFTERVSMHGPNAMQDELTIDDPLRFAHPWQVSIEWTRIDQDRMLRWSCENDRNPIENGKITIAPPKP
ncbi:MAG TPA: hypothetical protein VME21_01320 [Steroidobacteraceae bacterium]|nr:hypothetical protein [Steroidobacteraceae bacterium]